MNSLDIQRMTFASVDYDDFASMLRNANIEEKLLEAGSFKGTLKMVSSENFIVSNFSLNRKVLQTGTSVPGYITFVIWEPGIFFNWRKHEMKEGMLGILWNKEHQSVSKGGLIGLPISIREDYFINLCEIMGLDELPEKLRKNEFLSVSEHMLRQIRKCVKFITENDDLSNDARQDLIENDLLDLLFSCLSTASDEKYVNTEHSNLTNVLDYIHGNISEITSVHQVCKRMNVGERTLRRFIKKKYELSPKRYIHMLRLNQVRQSLKRESEFTNVIQAASEYNFWHMGQFSKDYKLLFGELPSATIKNIQSIG